MTNLNNQILRDNLSKSLIWLTYKSLKTLIDRIISLKFLIIQHLKFDIWIDFYPLNFFLAIFGGQGNKIHTLLEELHMNQSHTFCYKNFYKLWKSYLHL